MRTFRLLFAATTLLAGLSTAEPSAAAELKVMSSYGGPAIRASLQELAPAFEAASGHKLNIEYAVPSAVERKIAADEQIDVAILSQPHIATLVEAAKIVGGTTKVIVRAQIGLAVKKGAPKPDISSVEAFKQTLIKAKSVAYVDPGSGGTGGTHIAKVLERLAIPELSLKPRLMVADAVLRGDAAIGIQPIRELTGVEGIEVVGPLPAELQSPDLILVAGSPNASKQPVAAKTFIDFLGGANAKEVLKAKGLDPG
jgi:molybdate transport system substrate-binding protein